MPAATPEMREILDIIRGALGIAEGVAIDPGQMPESVPGWDSVGWVGVIAAVEERFDILLPAEGLEAVMNVGDFCRLVSSIRGDGASADRDG